MSAIIFDLDNCLAAASEPGEQLLTPVFDAVREANTGTLTPEALETALRDCWMHAFDWVAARHGFTEQMRAAGWTAFRQIEVRQPMHGYRDLDVLPTIGDVRFLVTSGFRRLQESKIRALGVAQLFAAVIIDALDEPNRRGKERIFGDLIREFSLREEDVVVVGDNAESELAAAKRLGLPRVQILRPGVERDPDATAHVRDLHELHAWVDARRSPPQTARMKQVIVVNESLRLPRGKLAAQVAHASVAALLGAPHDALRVWLETGMPKVVLRGDDAAHLTELERQANDAGLPTALIRDAGHTVVAAGTLTCLGIGPAPDTAIDAVTGALRLV